jgi:hypothetical protein
LNNGSSLELGIGTAGLNGAITGTGTALLDGALTLDLTGADVTAGNTWTVIHNATLNETYGANFSVTDFDPSGSTWTKVEGVNTWTFDQATGVLGLAVVPEPAAGGLLLAGLGALWAARRRDS